MSASPAGTSSQQFQLLAEARLIEARLLFAGGQWAGAYYLGGYCIECALKAIVTKNIVGGVLPPKGDLDKVYTHNLDSLIKLAGLAIPLATETKLRPRLAQSWAAVSQWQETKRYELGIDSKKAEDFLVSIDDPSDGMLPWLKQNW